MIQPSPAWSAPHPDAVIEPVRTNWLLSTAAGLGAGLLAGLIYAFITAASKQDFLMLIIGVGVVVGVVVMAVAKVDNMVTGLLSLGIAAVSIAVAIYLTQISLALGSFGKAFSHLGDFDVSVVFETYFGDPLGWVWVIAALVVAFYVGSGMGKKADASSRTPAVEEKAEGQSSEA